MAVSVGDRRATLELETSGFKKGAADASSATKSLQHVFEVFAGFSLANVFEESVGAIKAFVKESIKAGYEAKITEYGFESMAKQIGVSSDALVKAMKRASGDVVNESDVMRSASKALQASLAPEQIVQMMEIARAQSVFSGQTITEAFNSMADAISNQTTRSLKFLNIVIDKDDA